MSRPISPKPAPHPGLAASAIALMALLVAAALEMLGLIGPVDEEVTAWADSFGLEGDAVETATWMVWGWTALVTFGLCQALLHVVGNWRRWVLFGLAAILTLAWIPVLALAAMEIPLGIPLAALLWGGGGAMIYAVRHREPEAI